MSSAVPDILSYGGEHEIMHVQSVLEMKNIIQIKKHSRLKSY